MDLAGWTAASLPDLTGRSAMITGANSGVGLETALALARHGAQVVLACRDPARAHQALVRCRSAATGAAPLEVGLDLSDLGSVRRCAEELGRRLDRLDILVNNAGVMAVPRMLTVDGFELQLATNHLGHFALTGLLLPLLGAHPGARVVTVSSSLAARARTVDLGDLDGATAYDGWAAYHQSKLANLLFSFELARRARSNGADLISVAAHPGLSSTRLVANGPAAWAPAGARLSMVVGTRLVGQSARRGALPLLRAATDPQAHGGEYFGPRGPGHLRGRPVVVRAPRAARDLTLAGRLWSRSEDLTAVRYWDSTPTPGDEGPVGGPQ